MATIDFAPEPEQDEMDFAEELANCLSDPAFPFMNEQDFNDYVDTLAELYATEDDD